ncbi:MAG: hypothetical protein CMJ83_09855 [Planctomycetes bacterium]|nr:hypothetical protein [Planctomycetota bacterium]
MLSRRHATLALIVFVGLALIGSAAGQTPKGVGAKGVRVLFVGNSYTYFNDLPWVVSELGRCAKPPIKIHAERSVRPGATLERHWKDGAAKKAITSAKWDWVVLQEQSQRPIGDRPLMESSAKQFHEVIAKRKARTLFFMTWAREHKPDMQKGLTKSYTEIAAKLGAEVAPVGIAWQTVRKQRPKLKLHTNDRSHPNPTGTYLSALVFFAKLTGTNPVGLPARLEKDGKAVIALSKKDAAWLQGVARDVVRGRRK